MPVARQFRSNTWMGGTGWMWSEVNLSGGESHTAVLGEYLICDVTAGDITITLPDEVIGGDIFPIRRVGTGNSVVIQGSGNNIENPSRLLTPLRQSLRLISLFSTAPNGLLQTHRSDPWLRKN